MEKKTRGVIIIVMVCVNITGRGAKWQICVSIMHIIDIIHCLKVKYKNGDAKKCMHYKWHEAKLIACLRGLKGNAAVNAAVLAFAIFTGPGEEPSSRSVSSNQSWMSFMPDH